MAIFIDNPIQQVESLSPPPDLSALLAKSAIQHNKLCPRQVLGVRMGLYGAELLGIQMPNNLKRLLVILETDGCFADGVRAATGCSIGKRTLRIEDYGKVAATFVDTLTSQTIRLAPRSDVRDRAFLYAWEPKNRYHAQLEGYQVMPAVELFSMQTVQLRHTIQSIISEPGKRVLCDSCGEEIMNQREIERDNQVFCQSCLGHGYYELEGDADCFC